MLPFSWERIVDAGTEILFLATPHEQSREWVPEAIERGIKVVDLSGAWRLQETRNRDVYHLKDANAKLAADLQAEAVYGCPELHRDAIKKGPPGGQSRMLRDLYHPGACPSCSRRNWLILKLELSAMQSQV